MSTDDPYGRPLRVLEPPISWLMAIAQFVSYSKNAVIPKIMICGPRGAGKSTFGRMLGNALLAASSTADQEVKKDLHSNETIAFLDLDPGQPEFSPPGELSLVKLKGFNLGPSFTHPIDCRGNETISAHHFGYLSPMDNPHHFYQCALELHNQYRRMPSCPLIVNCSGWIQGSGLDLLLDLIKGFDLSDVVYMSKTGPQEVINVLEAAAYRRDIPLHQLKSQDSVSSIRTAADLRMMSTLSYFHADSIEGGNIRWRASPLTWGGSKVLVVRYEGLDPDILGVYVLGDEQNPEFNLSILKGCIVGIVAVEQDLIKEEDVGQNEIPNGMANEAGNADINHSTQLIPTGVPQFRPQNHTVHSCPPTRSHSLGQGIVHGYDTNRKLLFLITPISADRMKAVKQTNHKIVLVRGKLDTPTWAYMEDSTYSKAKDLRRKRQLGNDEGHGPEYVNEGIGVQLWAELVEQRRVPERLTRSGMVRKVRRDIRYRGQGKGN